MILTKLFLWWNIHQKFFPNVLILYRRLSCGPCALLFNDRLCYVQTKGQHLSWELKKAEELSVGDLYLVCQYGNGIQLSWWFLKSVFDMFRTCIIKIYPFLCGIVYLVILVSKVCSWVFRSRRDLQGLGFVWKIKKNIVSIHQFAPTIKVQQEGYYCQQSQSNVLFVASKIYLLIHLTIS